MTDKPDWEHCRRIKWAIEQGLSPHAAREETAGMNARRMTARRC